MFRLKALVALISCAASVCLAQTSEVSQANLNPKEIEQLLASEQPRDIAWAAYSIARQSRREMIPKLVALLASHQDAPIENRGSMPLNAAAIEAVADALIQLQAKLPGSTIMHLYPQFPAQTIILLSRASDNTAPLMRIFQTTPSRDLWLAAGNLLAIRPPPGFVRSVLAGIVVTFAFRVVAPSDKSETPGYGEGCAADFLMTTDPAFRGWPKIRMYALDTGAHPANIFAPGIHPVGFRFWETTDYRDSWTDGDCSPGKSTYWRTGLVAQMLGKSLRDFPLQPEIKATVPYLSAESFQDQVEATIEKQSTALANIVEAFVQSGALSLDDVPDLHLQCRIQIQDDRLWPRPDLPRIEGKWCTPAPLHMNAVGPPE